MKTPIFIFLIIIAAAHLRADGPIYRGPLIDQGNFLGTAPPAEPKKTVPKPAPRTGSSTIVTVRQNQDGTRVTNTFVVPAPAPAPTPAKSKRK